MSAQARCSSRRTAGPDADDGFPQHPIWNIQPEGLGDMFIGDKPFANFWTNCSSCPGPATKNRRRPGCCVPPEPRTPTCSVLAPSYSAPLTRSWSEHGPLELRDVVPPNQDSSGSCLSQLGFRDIHLWRQRRVTTRAPLGMPRPSREAAAHFAVRRVEYRRRLRIFFVGRLRHEEERSSATFPTLPRRTAGTVTSSNTAGLNRQRYSRVTGVGISQRAKPIPPAPSLTHAPNHPSIHPPTHAPHPCCPRFPPRLAGLLT